MTNRLIYAVSLLLILTACEQSMTLRVESEIPTR